MLINWFTVIAQLVNFFILVLLLKRYLYKPILKAIDEREKKISDKITEAEKREAEAIKEQESFKKKNEEFDHQRTSLMAKATEEAKTSGEELKEKTRADAETLRTKLEMAFEEDRNRMSQEIVSKTRKEVFVISGKVLKDMANSSLETQAIQKFSDRIQKIPADEKEKLLKAFGRSSNTITIESAFDITTSQKNLVETEVCQLLGGAPVFNYKISPELIAGIELQANGFKVAWSISDYLRAIEIAFDSVISSKVQTEKKENNKI
jgi:F-type H+-transporting ATPase subunit b